MSMIRRVTTPAIVAASPANGQKSNGPTTEVGRRNSSLTGSKHGVYARVFRRYYEKLGEDPEEFEQLRQGFREAFKPEDAFEEALVDDLVELRWRRQRLLLHQEGSLAERQRQMQIEVERRLHSEGKGVGGMVERTMGSSYGLASMNDSRFKFSLIIGFLREVRARLELGEFDEQGLKFLRRVYGAQPGFVAAGIIADYEEILKAKAEQNETTGQASRDSLLRVLGAEIESFERLEALDRETRLEVSEAAKHAALLPAKKDLKNMLRLERMIEREYQLKLDQWREWRRTKRESKAVDVESTEAADATSGAATPQLARRRSGRPKKLIRIVK